jgi:hypothetical protein
MRTLSLCALVLLAASEAALAQARVFISGDVFADHKRFSGNSTESTLDVTRAGGGGGIGAQVSDRWDVRGEIELGSRTTITEALLPPVTTFQARTRNRITAYSALVGFSPATGPRVRLTVVGGISFLHSKTEVDSVPAGLVVIPHTNIDNVAAPTVGAEVPIMLTSQVSIVPGMRLHAFTLRTDGTTGFGIRPGIGIRWIN